MRTRSAIAAGLAVLGAGCGGHAAERTRAAAGPSVSAGTTADTASGRPADAAATAEPARGRPGPALALTTRLPAAYRRVCARQRAVAPPRARTCPPSIPAGRLDVIDAASLKR